MKRLLFPILALSLGCSPTGTGNPISESATASFLRSASLAGGICQKLKSCNDIFPTDCYTKIGDLTNIDTEIGLVSGQFAKFLDIINAEANGTLRAKSTGTRCLLAIEELACDNPVVKNAYASGIPQPFFRVAEMIPVACADMF